MFMKYYIIRNVCNQSINNINIIIKIKIKINVKL
jgi:hypothetical protein